MELLEKFTNITREYDTSMLEIFKKIIDEAKMESEKRNLDSIKTFLYVNEKLRDAFTQLALVVGIISDEKQYNEALNCHILSENLLESIYNYIEPIIQEVRNSIKLMGEDILESSSLAELQNKYNSLFSILSIKAIQENDYLYEGIEFTKKNI